MIKDSKSDNPWLNSPLRHLQDSPDTRCQFYVLGDKIFLTSEPIEGEGSDFQPCPICAK